MGLLPGRPDGNADRLRDGADAWEGLAHDLWVMENDLRARGPGLAHDWWRGAASDAYADDWQHISAGFGGVDQQLHTVAHTLRDAAGQIETAQNVYDGIAAGVGLTTLVGIGLTAFTFGASDAIAGDADAAEIGAATTAIDLLGSAIRGVVETMEGVAVQLEAALARLTLALDALPPLVVEAGAGSALTTGMTLVGGERDMKVLALWATAGALDSMGDPAADEQGTVGDEDGVVPRAASARARAGGCALTLQRPVTEPPAGEITLEQAAAAASRNGIDMSRIELRYVTPGSPDYLANTAGHTSFNGAMEPILNSSGQYVIYMQDAGLVSEREAYITIVHELGHIHDPAAEEDAVEQAAQEAGRNFIP